MAVVAAADMPDFLTLYASSSRASSPSSMTGRTRMSSRGPTPQLEAEANRLANVLASLGVGPGEKVIWCGPNSPQVVAVVNATRKLAGKAGQLTLERWSRAR